LIHVFLTSALVRGEWSVSRSGRFTSGENPRYSLDRNLGGPIAGLEDVEKGRAVAQAVSRWLPTAAARVRVRAASGVCGGQSGTGAGFLRVLRFPLPIIPPSSLSS
jgi:hypothetical protein